MNPLLFADWGRMNRHFIRAMWGLAAIMICIICLAVTTSGGPSHAQQTARSAASAGMAPQTARSAASAGVDMAR